MVISILLLHLCEVLHLSLLREKIMLRAINLKFFKWKTAAKIEKKN